MDPVVAALLMKIHQQIQLEGRELQPYEKQLFTETVVLGNIVIPTTKEQIDIANKCAKWHFALELYNDRPFSSESPDDYCGDLSEWLKALETSNFAQIHAKCENFIACFRKGFEALSPEEQTAIRNRVIKRKQPVAQEYLPDEVKVILGIARAN